MSTATEHERDKIQKLAQEGLAKFTGENVAPAIVTQPVQASRSIQSDISNQSRE